MINLIVALVAGAAMFALLVTFFAWYAALVPALLVAVGVYLWLAQRAMKQVQDLSERAQKEMMAQRFDRAIEIFKGGFELSKRQFWVAPLIHANIGMLLYVKKDFEAALPHLEQGFARNYLARAMLASHYFRQKDYAKMREAFELAVKHGKKDGLVWAIYAYCLTKIDAKDEAQKVLARAVETNPTDEKLKNALQALQNNKKMKMRAYEPQYFQFHIEELPRAYTQPRVQWERR